MRIFELSAGWPLEERYALTDQIRRSSRSVCENVAEAWRKRRYPRHFVSKLSDTDAEAAETRVWLSFATRCGYLDAETTDELDGIYNRICGGLVRIMNRPGQWMLPNDLAREAEAAYTPTLDDLP